MNKQNSMPNADDGRAHADKDAETTRCCSFVCVRVCVCIYVCIYYIVCVMCFAVASSHTSVSNVTHSPTAKREARSARAKYRITFTCCAAQQHQQQLKPPMRFAAGNAGFARSSTSVSCFMSCLVVLCESCFLPNGLS